MSEFTVKNMETLATDIPVEEGILIANDGRIFVGAEP